VISIVITWFCIRSSWCSNWWWLYRCRWWWRWWSWRFHWCNFLGHCWLLCDFSCWYF